MSQQDIARYERALHAMQTAVAYEHGRGSNDGSPKHLRVGVNSALVSVSGLCTLLKNKGVITQDEIDAMLADAMEAEVARYEAANPGLHFH